VTQSSTKYTPLSSREQWLTTQIVDIAISIHKSLGPGLLESVYEKCFGYELSKRDIPFIKQQCVEIIYDNLVIDDGLRIDILVENLIIIELKAQENFHPVWEDLPIPTFPVGRPSTHSPCLFDDTHGFTTLQHLEFLIDVMNNEPLGSVLLRSPSTGGI